MINIFFVAECDSQSLETQCSEGEICRNNVCEPGTQCTSSTDCSNEGLDPNCVASYCQPSRCTATGQCGYGYLCFEGFNTGSCRLHVIRSVAENTPTYQLDFIQTLPGPFSQITWYKGIPAQQIVTYIEDLALRYQSEYCRYGGCTESDRAELNTQTGALTIKQLDYMDNDYYTYTATAGSSTTGYDYVIQLEVFVQAEKPIIEGLEDIIEADTKTTFICSVERIRPSAKRIYWTVDRDIINGTVRSHDNADDSTFRQINTATYIFTKNQHRSSVICHVIPQAEGAEAVEQGVRVDVGYGPVGTPTIYLNPQEGQYEGSLVSLACSGFVQGNPKTYTFTWKRDGYTMEINDNSKDTLEFFMEPVDEGNYTCMAQNVYGSTEESTPVELLLLGEPPPSDGGNSSQDLVIVGGAVASVVLIIIVTAGIAFWMYRKRVCGPKGERSTYDDTEVTQTERGNETGTGNRDSGPENHVYNYIDLNEINSISTSDVRETPTYINGETPRTENAESSQTNNDAIVIQSVYNNAQKGPPKQVKVNHYEQLRHNAECQEVKQSGTEIRDGSTLSTGFPYYNINNTDGRDGFDNRGAEIDHGVKTNISDGYEVPVNRQCEGQTQIHVESF